MQNASYYITNSKYTQTLKQVDQSYYQKYVDLILKYSITGSKTLDVGCGAGQVITQLAAHDRDAVGLDISQTSVDLCTEEGLNALLYDGSVFPFEDATVDVVGCCNVIEHVDDVDLFLSEMDRVLTSGGAMCIICPNFLSLTNNYHHHTRGLLQKAKNGLAIIKKLLTPGYTWDKMDVIVRDDFHVDDDACNVMNPFDLSAWLNKHNYSVEYRSCKSWYGGATKYFDIPVLRSVFGSVCIVATKS